MVTPFGSVLHRRCLHPWRFRNSWRHHRRHSVQVRDDPPRPARLFRLNCRATRPRRIESWFQTPLRAVRNIRFHYDRSNDLYRSFLDSRMVYSCAYFKDPGCTLDEAQAAKLDHICRKLGSSSGGPVSRYRVWLGRAGCSRRREIWRTGRRLHIEPSKRVVCGGSNRREELGRSSHVPRMRLPGCGWPVQ